MIAPADGTIVEVDDGIEDNSVGEVNTTKNWGNTIIIKHAEGLYSKLCHLQKDSILVKPGDHVHYGQKIAKVGNSGRSPYPHLHFQIQSTPYIGSKTTRYPIFAFLENGKEIKTYSYPSSNQLVKSIEGDPLLSKAFNLTPGRRMNWRISSNKGVKSLTWEVFTNMYNKSYIFCHDTKSYAYFENDGAYFYFTHFEGNRNSLLYSFYLAAFRVPLVYVEGYLSVDYLPINKTFSGWRLFLHDFTAPFYVYLKTKIEVSTSRKGSQFDTDEISCYSKLSGYSFNRLIGFRSFKMAIGKDGCIYFEDTNHATEALCESFLH